ncbi:MAG: glycosyltransferase family 9 protein [Caldimonas sp.]
MPFDDEIADNLAAEYAEQPYGRRFQARRKALARDAMLVVTGQSTLHVDAAPAVTRRMLWLYSWTTVGDAIMDLAPRDLLPAGVAVELLIAPALAPLFATDRRFAAVHTDIAACAAETDFVLLDSLRTSSIRLKMTHFPKAFFATMRGHHTGERFDRVAFADRRLRQLFRLPTGLVESPRIDLGSDEPPPRGDSRFRVGVALGSRVPKKLYPHWGRVLDSLVAGWPSTLPAPEFVLLGQGESAQAQRGEVEAATSRLMIRSLVDGGSLRKTAIDLAACDAFLGVDGGLMHVAVAVGTPGLALFTRIDPAYFLRPESTMTPLATAGELAAVEPSEVTAAFLAALPRLCSNRGRATG